MTSTPRHVDEHGSFITRGPRYSVLQCRGPVLHRQQLASARLVICYAEAHLNSVPDPTVQHGFVITGQNTPPKTEQWAGAYLRRIGSLFDVPTKGIVRGVPGQGCVMHVRWPTPTMLLEPLFLSGADIFHTAGETLETVIERLGRALAESIIECFPSGGLVGLSIGHMYRGTGDRGARSNREWEWEPEFDDEGELCEAYVNRATEILTETTP